jgi:MFS family permease
VRRRAFPGVLVTMRVLQAVGGAALLANGNAIKVAVLSPQQRGAALGINSTVYSVGYALGYVGGGVLIDSLG